MEDSRCVDAFFHGITSRMHRNPDAPGDPTASLERFRVGRQLGEALAHGAEPLRLGPVFRGPVPGLRMRTSRQFRHYR